MTNYIRERNKLIQKYIIDNKIKNGEPDWWLPVATEFDVSKKVIEGIYYSIQQTAKSVLEAIHDLRHQTINAGVSVDENYEGQQQINTKLANDIYPVAFDVNDYVIKKETATDQLKGRQTVDIVTSQEIKTLEELIKICEIDTSRYTITKTKHGTWTTGKERKFSVSVEAVLKKTDDTFFADLLAEFRRIVTSVRASASEPKRDSSCGKTVIVPLSDIHIGMDVDKNSLYPLKYNKTVIADRFFAITDKILQMAADYGRFKKLYILNMGDDLDGFKGKTTREGHLLPQNLESKDQYKVFMQVFTYMFDVLVEADIAEEIEYICTTNANHSSEFSFICNESLKLYLNAKYPFVNVTINERFINHFQVNNKVTYVYLHGKDDKHMKHGLPLNLNDKTENYLNDYINSYKINTEQIHVIKGDLHQSATGYGKRFRYKNLPAICPPSAWVQVNFGSGVSAVDIEVIDQDNNLIEHKLKF